MGAGAAQVIFLSVVGLFTLLPRIQAGGFSGSSKREIDSHSKRTHPTRVARHEQGSERLP